MDRGATIDGFDEDGMGALHHVVGGERVDMLELLLDRGASLNKALHIAVTWGDSVDIMKFILDRGAASNRDGGQVWPHHPNARHRIRKIWHGATPSEERSIDPRGRYERKHHHGYY